MSQRPVQVLTALAITALLGFAWEGGLFQGAAPPQPTASAPPHTVPSRREVIEQPQENSPVKQIVHVYEKRPGDVEVNIYDVLVYYDRHTETNFKDAGGKNKRIVTTNANGVTVSDQTFSDDGSTIIASDKWRNDGSLIAKLNTDSAGVRVSVEYYWTGNEIFSQTTTQPDGTYTAEFYHRRGQDHGQISKEALWAKRAGSNRYGLKVSNQEDYSNGQVTTSWSAFSNRWLLTVFRPDQTIKLKKQLEEVQPYLGMGGFGGSTSYTAINWIEEYDQSGTKMLRRIEMKAPEYGHVTRPEMFIIPLPNGKLSKRAVDTDGTVLFEQITERDGTVVSGTDYRSGAVNAPKPNRPPRQTIDTDELAPPTMQDPVAVWSHLESSQDARSSEPL